MREDRDTVLSRRQSGSVDRSATFARAALEVLNAFELAPPTGPNNLVVGTGKLVQTAAAAAAPSPFLIVHAAAAD
jgi:hypothetical protein